MFSRAFTVLLPFITLTCLCGNLEWKGARKEIKVVVRQRVRCVCLDSRRRNKLCLASNDKNYGIEMDAKMDNLKINCENLYELRF